MDSASPDSSGKSQRGRRRNQRLFGLAGATTAAVLLSVPSQQAALATDDDSNVLLNPDRVLRRVQELGIKVSDEDVVGFLDATPSERATLLSEAGMLYPEGALRDPAANEFLYGQGLAHSVPGSQEAVHMMLHSGKLPANKAFELLRSMSADHLYASSDQINATQIALGLSPDAARLRSKVQNLSMYISTYAPQLITGMSFVAQVDEPEPSIVIGVSGGADLTGLIGDSMRLAGIAVTVEKTKLSAADAEDEIEHVRAALRSEAGEGSFSSWFDARSETLLVQPSSAEVTAKVIAAVERLSQSKMAVTVEEVRKAMNKPLLRGGIGSRECTWGFMAGDQGHTRLVGAGHCLDDPMGYGAVGPIFFTTRVDHEVEGNVDARKDSLPAPYNDPSFADNEIWRGDGLGALDITSRTTWVQMSIGNVVCHQGKATEHSCGTIYSKFIQPSFIPGAHSFLGLNGPALEGAGGDSGGPCFWGNTAIGIASSANGNLQPDVTVGCGAINYAEAELGFTVLTK